MIERAVDVLRLQPQAIPALRAEFQSAVDQIETVLGSLRQRGFLPAPWLGDEVSAEVADHYTRRAMTDPDSAYQALVKYRDELRRAHVTLGRMEADYLRAESDATRRGRSA
jgi:hypothetical protein